MSSQGPNKYNAVWVSHSSMGDFLTCPRLYYLNNIYKDPATGRKISLINPALALGSAVHNTIEPLANVPAEKRLDQPIEEKFESEWEKVSGRRGGFSSGEQEAEYKARGEEMIARVIENPGPLVNKALRLPSHKNNMPPNFYLSEADNIILCGKIDWLEYLPEEDAVHIIDFKTGKKEEKENSLQLPIYLLLVTNCQKRPVKKASYWYLDRSTELEEKELPTYEEAKEVVLSVAKRVKTAREKVEFACPQGSEGCFACRPYEAIVAGEATLIGVNEIGQDLYVLL